ncbi:uroporphyrinogen-III C-methyltransferase [Pengzhenrongella sp.]|jgi:uroporphyrin-III C-methyltransferase/precorrin-2 dehydrogenase/sirohydrochlorin ferrochelatase|uniref:uroporphyrinogen-III C-methyltransferase n=1 Tax=Pengzhenrongella sp. TaxID=2888820 RepID=UPI002F9435B6
MSVDVAPANPGYPLTLRVAGRLVVVVGGGPVAARRVRGLVEAGAQVRVVAPGVVDEIAVLAADGVVTWEPREYRAGDLDGAWLVHTATGVAAVDAAVAQDADSARVWCVQASDAQASGAWVPAVARVDDVVVAVNAGGDPGRAVAVRNAVASLLHSGELPLRRFRRRAADGERVEVGSVALVGGGPGDPDLLTVRGRRLLAEADVVVVDKLAPRAVLSELAPDVIVIDVGKSPGHHAVPQDRINALLVEHALAGLRVVRLKGGDPYVFGRGSEESAVCRAAGVPVEIVSGVTSAISVPAAAGIPVTHRGISRGFTVLTGHEEIGAIPPTEDHTVVLLMGVSLLAKTCSALVAAGRSADTPVAVIEDGFGPGQRVTTGTLATIAERAFLVGVKPPAVTVIGGVVRQSPAWVAQGGTLVPEKPGRHNP